MISGWHATGRQDCAWLMYSANYLFRTGITRWALDPLLLTSRIPEAPQVPIARDLHGLSFALLTHHHVDHLDVGLLRELRGASIQWVVPEAILAKVIDEAGLSEEKLIIPRALDPIRFGAITITPFDGLHWESQLATGDGRAKEVRAMGYLVEFSGKRWLFPGDTRTYEAGLLPSFGSVDVLFAHVWLGRGAALVDPPPLVDAFSQFCVNLQPRRVILTHLHEFGRDATEYWDDAHAGQVIKRLHEICPEMHAEAAKMGERVDL